MLGVSTAPAVSGMPAVPAMSSVRITVGGQAARGGISSLSVLPLGGALGPSTFQTRATVNPLIAQPAFQVPVFFAAAQGSGTSGSVPPSTGGANGANGASGGNGGRGPKNGGIEPLEAAAHLRRDVVSGYITGSSVLKLRLEEDLQGFSSIEAKLAYMQAVASWMGETSIESFRFPLAELVGILHNLAQRVGLLTDYQEPSGVVTNEGISMSGTLGPIFSMIVEIEKKMLREGRLTHDASHMIADVHSVYTKAVLFPSASRRIENGNMRPVILTVMHMLDVIERYVTIGLDRDARVPSTLLTQLTRAYRVDGDPHLWVETLYDEMLRSDHVSMLAMLEDPSARHGALQWFDEGLADFLNGLYLFSPWILRRVSHLFTMAGMPEQAAEYSERAQDETGIATRLNLAGSEA